MAPPRAHARADRRRRFGAWFGLLLLIADLLAIGGTPPRASTTATPLFAQDLAGDRIVICTAGGMVVIDRATGQPVPPDADAPHRDLCVFCLPCLQGGFALPTVAALARPAAPAEAAPLFPERPSHRPPRPTSQAWPRGPPGAFPA